MQSRFVSATIGIEKRRTARRRSQKGATLLEAIAFLGIAAIILLGAVALFSSAFSSARSNSLMQQVTAIQNAIRTTYGTGTQLQTNLANGIAGLVQANALPSTLAVGANNAVTNDWGGPVTVAWDSTNAAAQITYGDVPKAACISALTSSGSFTTVSTDSKTYQAAPVGASAAAAACSGSSNTVTWEFIN